MRAVGVIPIQYTINTQSLHLDGDRGIDLLVEIAPQELTITYVRSNHYASLTIR